MAIGVVALGVSMWMNFRFGWGLSSDFMDRTTLAILHVLVDPAAAGLVFVGTMMRRSVIGGFWMVRVKWPADLRRALRAEKAEGATVHHIEKNHQAFLLVHVDYGGEEAIERDHQRS
jgi:hypothetical protein